MGRRVVGWLACASMALIAACGGGGSGGGGGGGGGGSGGNPTPLPNQICDSSNRICISVDRLIILVGIATVKPAEFVIFRISQKTREAVG